MTTRNESDDYHWFLCPECECGISEVDISLGECTNCKFRFEDEGDTEQ